MRPMTNKDRPAYAGRIRKLLELGEMKRPLRLLYRYIRPNKLLYAQLILLMLGSIGISLAFTWFMQELTNSALNGDIGRIQSLVLQGIIVMAVSGFVTYSMNQVGTAAIQKVKLDLKNDMFAHMIRLPARYYNKTHSGELVSRLTNDINNLDGAIGGNLIQMIRLPLLAAASLIYMLTISWKLSLLCFLLVPLAAASGTAFGKLLRRNSRQIQEFLGRLQSFLNESFSASAVIRSFSLGRLMSQKYEEQNKGLMELELKQARLRGWFQVGSGVVGSATFFLSMGLGAYLVAQRSMTVGDLVAFNNLMHYMVSPLSGLAGLWGGFQRSLSSAERIVHLLEEEAEPQADSVPAAVSEASAARPAHQTDSATAPSSTPAAVREIGSAAASASKSALASVPVFTTAPVFARTPASAILLKQVGFAYDEGRPVLEGLDLAVQAGQTVALVGHSGAGKSTVLQLLQRSYTPSAGEILYGGRPLDSIPLSQLRESIAYVPQDTFLFSGTIRDNIGYGRAGASEEEIRRAARDANAEEFIQKLPYGYDTEVGERGIRLSGGQKQRLAIARAILRDAPLLLLDEATSALDTATEQLVQEALVRLMHNRTCIIIAHRLSTIRHADMIAVMDRGRVVETGSHWELLARRGHYYRLYQMQFKDQDDPGAHQHTVRPVPPGQTEEGGRHVQSVFHRAIE